jgi:hypothetical protein
MGNLFGKEATSLSSITHAGALIRLAGLLLPGCNNLVRISSAVVCLNKVELIRNEALKKE